MAKIFVSKDKAIKVLNDRIDDLRVNFDETVWKSKTENDLKEIFGITDGRYIEVKFFNFKDMYGVLDFKRKQIAENLLKSYIEFIQTHVTDPLPAQVTPQTDWKAIAIGYKANYDSSCSLVQQQNATIDELIATNSLLEDENETLKESIFNIDDLTIKKLLNLFIHLPFSTAWQVVVFLVALLTFIFFSGVWAHSHNLVSL